MVGFSGFLADFVLERTKDQCAYVSVALTDFSILRNSLIGKLQYG